MDYDGEVFEFVDLMFDQMVFVIKRVMFIFFWESDD